MSLGLGQQLAECDEQEREADKGQDRSGALPATINTDGIWLAMSGVPGFESGAFFAVHDDQAVSAFDWGQVIAALDLEACR